MKKLLLVIVSLLNINAQAAEVKTYDHLNIDESRMLVLKGTIDETLINPLIKKAKELDDQNNNPIYLIINSPGGSVGRGFEFANVMSSAKSKFICAVDMKAYSMAAILLTFCDKVYVQRFATVMFHEASFDIDGSESQVKTRVNFLLDYLAVLHSHVAKNLNLPLDEYKKRIHNEWWMTANQAVEQGVATGILKNLTYHYEEPEKQFSIFFRNGDDGSIVPDITRYFTFDTNLKPTE